MSAALQQTSSAPTQEEAETAKNASESLARHLHPGDSLKLSIADANDHNSFVLPADAAVLLLGILRMMAKGQVVALTPLHSELTTSQAAEMLGVSRPHLITLLDTGKLPHHKVGSHRRIRREDVMTYKQEFEEAREAFLTRLAAESQELGLYD